MGKLQIYWNIWVQMWVRPCCQTTAKVVQICPANQQLLGWEQYAEGCKYHFAEDIQTFLKFCFWGPTQKVFYIFAIFDWYIGMCFMANLRITELQEHSCPALCSKLICSSVPSINWIFTHLTEMWLLCFVCAAPRWAGEAAGLVFAVQTSELQLDSANSMQVKAHSVCQIPD